MQKFRIKKTRSDKLAACCSLMAGMAEPSSQVEPGGGKYGNGLIKGPAVITRGEALGHYFWIDTEMLTQVANELTAAGTTGVKSRLGHPNWSDDKTGRGLGRLIGGQLDGDTVRAGGLHLSRAASKSPGGDLADWLLTQAVEDSEAIGLSIDFEHDYEAEIAFLEAHGAKWEKDDLGRYLNLDEFQSPDPMNVDNLPHGRLKKLRAADVVDTPAANPAGLLSDDDQAAEVEQAVRYIAGLSDDRPAEFLTLPADMLRESFSEFLAERRTEGQNMPQDQLNEDRNNPETKASEATDEPKDELTQDEQKPEADAQPSDESPADEQPAEPVSAGGESQLSAQQIVKQYANRFGEKGMGYLTEGLSVEQAQARFNKELREENEQLSSRLAAVEAAGGSLGDEQGVSHQPTGGQQPETKRNGLTGLAAALCDGMQARTKKSK